MANRIKGSWKTCHEQAKIERMKLERCVTRQGEVGYGSIVIRPRTCTARLSLLLSLFFFLFLFLFFLLFVFLALFCAAWAHGPLSPL